MGIEFEEDQGFSRTIERREPEKSGMVGFLIKKGIAKNATQANLILLGLIGVLIVVIIVSLNIAGSGAQPTPPSPDLVP